MQMTDTGLRLIMKYEGFRSRAYRDPVGIWTIGYGHTSRAGWPHVHKGLVVTRTQGREIFRRDVETFAEGVRRLVKVELSDGQFSALVSFAYNVGLGGLARSSVLRAVNEKRFAAVPRRLALWVKAGGRRLPGLVKRRAAEGAMFMAATGTQGEGARDEPARRKLEPVQGKPLHKSTSNWAALLSALAGLCSAFGAVFKDIAAHAGGKAALMLAVLVIVAATVWIWRERYIKSRHDGV